MNSNKTQEEYVKIKQIGIIKAINVPTKVLLFDLEENSMSFRYEGFTSHEDTSISSNDVFKDGLLKFVILRRLTKWEILDFIVYDFISGFYDDCEYKIDVLVNSKSKEECLYMQKSSNYAIERFLPSKMLYVIIFGIVIGAISKEPNYGVLFTLLCGVFFYYKYHNHRKRYHQILLKLEANIYK